MLNACQTVDLCIALKKSETEVRQSTEMGLQQQSTIDRLVEEIESLSKLRDPDASLPYICCLPTELIVQIFVASEGHSRLGLTFSQVCRGWKDIAIGTPQLWTSISMQLSESHLNGQMSLLQTLCERSGILPLSITLTGRHLPLSTFTTLIPYTSRIEAMHLWKDSEKVDLRPVTYFSGSNQVISQVYLCDHAVSLPWRRTCCMSWWGDSEKVNLLLPVSLFSRSNQVSLLIFYRFYL
jgi:hypothetical protein